MPAKISFFWLVNSITRATRVSSNALTDERSMISMPGSASTSSGNVGPHILSRAVVITMIGNFSPFAALARATAEHVYMVLYQTQRDACFLWSSHLIPPE